MRHNHRICGQKRVSLNHHQRVYARRARYHPRAKPVCLKPEPGSGSIATRSNRGIHRHERTVLIGMVKMRVSLNTVQEQKRRCVDQTAPEIAGPTGHVVQIILANVELVTYRSTSTASPVSSYAAETSKNGVYSQFWNQRASHHCRH